MEKAKDDVRDAIAVVGRTRRRDPRDAEALRMTILRGVRNDTYGIGRDFPSVGNVPWGTGVGEEDDVM